MLSLEKIRNKYHQIWITVDGEKCDTKFACRLKGENKLFFIRIDVALPLHWRRVFVNHHIFAHPNLFNKHSALPSAIPFLVSVVGMARDSRGRFYKEAPQPRPRPSSSVLSAAPAKRVRFRGDEEEPS
jgi:hypothetical protein